MISNGVRSSRVLCHKSRIASPGKFLKAASIAAVFGRLLARDRDRRLLKILSAHLRMNLHLRGVGGFRGILEAFTRPFEKAIAFAHKLFENFNAVRRCHGRVDKGRHRIGTVQIGQSRERESSHGAEIWRLGSVTERSPGVFENFICIHCKSFQLQSLLALTTLARIDLNQTAGRHSTRASASGGPRLCVWSWRRSSRTGCDGTEISARAGHFHR